MKTYKIKNWEKYQHYKDRCPPWIKLHWELLASKDWVMLDNASRVLAIAIMLIASRNDGIIVDDPEYIKRVAYLNEKPDISKLLEVGFITLLADASDCKRLQAKDTQETEAETEKIKEIYKEKVTEYSFEQFWNDYAKKIGLKKCKPIYDKISEPERLKIKETVKEYVDSHPDKNYLKHPETYLRNECWNDEIIKAEEKIDPDVAYMRAAIAAGGPMLTDKDVKDFIPPFLLNENNDAENSGNKEKIKYDQIMESFTK